MRAQARLLEQVDRVALGGKEHGAPTGDALIELGWYAVPEPRAHEGDERQRGVPEHRVDTTGVNATAELHVRESLGGGALLERSPVGTRSEEQETDSGALGGDVEQRVQPLRQADVADVAADGAAPELKALDNGGVLVVADESLINAIGHKLHWSPSGDAFPQLLRLASGHSGHDVGGLEAALGYVGEEAAIGASGGERAHLVGHVWPHIAHVQDELGPIALRNLDGGGCQEQRRGGTNHNVEVTHALGGFNGGALAPEVVPQAVHERLLLQGEGLEEGHVIGLRVALGRVEQAVA